MTYSKITFRPYRRCFTKALRTSRGAWLVREGFLLRVEQEGRVGFGEVAPIPEFGSESVEDARVFLESLQADPSPSVPEALPSCAFALSSALYKLESDMRDYAVAGLLPAGKEAVAVVAGKTGLGYRTLKWKVGVETPEFEQGVPRGDNPCVARGSDASTGMRTVPGRRRFWNAGWIFYKPFVSRLSLSSNRWKWVRN